VQNIQLLKAQCVHKQNKNITTFIKYSLNDDHKTPNVVVHPNCDDIHVTT